MLKTLAGLVACACLLLLLLLLPAAAQAQAKAWRRIVPLRTTRAEVERRLGKPREGFYEFRGERAFIHYSNGRGCDGRNSWNVPRDTVVRVIVTPKTILWLPSLRLDLRKFEKTIDPQSRALYTDKETGLTYEVVDGGPEDGRILHIKFGPTEREIERILCADAR